MKEPSNPDQAAWVREILNRYERVLVRFALRYSGGDLERARDAVQDTFLKLISQDRCKVEDHVAEWLFTVCRNRCLDVMRKERRMQELDEHREQTLRYPGGERSGSVESDENRGDILRMLEALPDRQQEVIRLKFQGGLSYREISRVTELTVSNVGFLIHTGLKTIREKLNRESGEQSQSNLGIAG